MAAGLASLGAPVVVALEGGYNLAAVAASTAAVAAVLLGAEPPPVGSRVRIVDLVRNAQHNGTLGWVAAHRDGGRVEVDQDGKALRCRPENLERVAGAGSEEEGGSGVLTKLAPCSVALACRMAGTPPYVWCGELELLSMEAGSRPLRFEWRLKEFDALKAAPAFKELLKAAKDARSARGMLEDDGPAGRGGG